MKRASAILLAITVLFAVVVSAQGPPTPAPELKNLEYFAGTWSFDGDMKPGPLGPGGKVTGTEHNEWMDGSFFLVGHSEMKSSMGSAKGIAVLGYDPQEKKYTYNEFNSVGEKVDSRGVKEGDTWTFTNDENMGGQPMKARFSMKIVSPTEYTFKFEMAPSGADFAVLMDGKVTKTK